MHSRSSPREAEGTGLQLSVARAFFGNFKTLRAAQISALPAIRSGMDVLIIAGTGSGKTEAMMAPLVDERLSALRSASHPSIIYVAPTRALVNDVYRRLLQPLGLLEIRLGVRHGERNDLSRVNKPAVLVTTPESLDVLVSRHRQLLAHVTAVVVDEAHQLYNTQRGLQLGIVINRLSVVNHSPLQVVGASATIANAAHIWQFLRPGSECVVVSDPSKRQIHRQVRIGLTPSQLAERLERLSGSATKVLVFASSRNECDELASVLASETSFAARVFAHHSSLSKHERERVEGEFQMPRQAICVATNTLELGIDIGDIDLIVLWGSATGWETVVQRIGRGNRRTSTVDVLCVIPRRDVTSLASLLGYQAVFGCLESGQLGAASPVHLYGAAVQQILAHVTGSDRAFTPAREIEDFFQPWGHLSPDLVQRLLDELAALDYLIRHPVKRWYGPADKAHRLQELRLVWSNLPLSGQKIPMMVNGNEIAKVSGTNLAALEPGVVVLLAGRKLRILSILPDRIESAGCSDPVTARIQFDGQAIEADPLLLESEWQLLAGDYAESILPAGIRDEFRAALHELAEVSRIDGLPFFALDGRYVHLTFAGRSLNEVIALWLGLRDYEVTDVSISSTAVLDLSSLPRRIEDFGSKLDLVGASGRNRSLFQDLLPADVQIAERRERWLSDPSANRTLTRLRAAAPTPINPPRLPLASTPALPTT